MDKSKFHVFVENLKNLLSMINNIKRCIQLYNYMVKLWNIFLVGKSSIEFEEDIIYIKTDNVSIANNLIILAKNVIQYKVFLLII